MEKKDNNLVFYVSKDRNGSEFVLVDQNRTTSSKSFLRLTYTILSNITLLCFYYYRNIWSKLCVHIWSNKKFSLFLITLLAVSFYCLAAHSKLLAKYDVVPLSSSGENTKFDNIFQSFWLYLKNNSRKPQPSKRVKRWLFLLLLLCAGDIELNPGPTITIKVKKWGITKYEIEVEKKQVSHMKIVSRYILLSLLHYMSRTFIFHMYFIYLVAFCTVTQLLFQQLMMCFCRYGSD